MNHVKLKTGVTIPEPTAVAVFGNLKKLFSEDFLAFFELVELCRNDKHEFWDDNVKNTLASLAFIKSNGQIHSDTKAVVLAATEGDGMNLTLVSPVAA